MKYVGVTCQRRGRGDAQGTHSGPRSRLQHPLRNRTHSAQEQLLHGFGMGGHQQGRGPLCSQPPQQSATENNSLESRERQHTPKPKNWFSIPTPQPSGLRQKEGVWVLWQKILLSGETWACEMCEASLHRSPCWVRENRPELAAGMGSCRPMEPPHRELKSNLDK